MITITEICAAIDLSRPTVYRMIREGRFPRATAKAGDRSLWDRSAIAKWCDDRADEAVGIWEEKIARIKGEEE